MKKIVLTFLLSITLISCSNNKKVEIVKDDMLKKNMSKEEIKKYEFNTSEVTGKDAFNSLFNKLQKKHKDFSELSEFESASKVMKQIDSLQKEYKSTIDKKFTLVEVVKNSDAKKKAINYYITEDNKIYNIN